jgi:hypothetical protein
LRRPAQRERHRADHGELHDLDAEHRERLAREQARPGQRRRAEPLEHAVAPLEPVAIARPVNAVDSTASARTPGARRRRAADPAGTSMSMTSVVATEQEQQG